jgi:hypothetical protein
MPEASSFGPASVDLRLHNEFRLFKNHIDVIDVSEDVDYNTVTEKYVLGEGESLLCCPAAPASRSRTSPSNSPRLCAACLKGVRDSLASDCPCTSLLVSFPRCPQSHRARDFQRLAARAPPHSRHQDLSDGLHERSRRCQALLVASRSRTTSVKCLFRNTKCNDSPALAVSCAIVTNALLRMSTARRSPSH